jgi:hypothetical protein
MGHLDKHLTGIVLGYHRPQNIMPILTALRERGLSNVIVWDNSDDARCIKAIGPPFGDTMVANYGGPNRMCFGRFTAAAGASTKHIYVQDDDAAPSDVEELLYQCVNHRRLAVYLDESHTEWSKRHYKLDDCRIGSYETLLGWGGVFEKEWLSVFLRYFMVFPECDEILCREADRIFAMLLCQPHIELKTEIKHMDGACDSDALWRQPQHKDFGRLARVACRRILNTYGGCPAATA